MYDAGITRIGTELSESYYSWFSPRPFRLQGGRHVLSRQLLFPVLPRCAHLPEQGPGTLAADRQCARPQ